MRLHFLVTSYLNLYVWDPRSNDFVIGSKHPYPKTIANKQSHLMTVDKLVAELHVGDTLLEEEDQIKDKVIKHYSRDEGYFISDFDGFMGHHGNEFLPGLENV